jgi:hypothetical protein
VVAKTYADVQSEFLSAAYAACTSPGKVIVRGDETILEVECQGGQPYNIRGRLRRGFFHGRHVGMPDDFPVEAKWILLDDRFIGTWVEDRTDSWFAFLCRERPLRMRRLLGRPLTRS